LRGSGPEREAAGRKAAQARFTQALAASLTQALARYVQGVTFLTSGG